jgi:hypothetical protein
MTRCDDRRSTDGRHREHKAQPDDPRQNGPDGPSPEDFGFSLPSECVSSLSSSSFIHSSSSSLSLLSIIIVSIFELGSVTARFPSPWAACTSPCRAWVGGYRRVTQRGFHREIPAGQRRQLSRHPTACQAQWQACMAPTAASRRLGGPRCLENGGHPRAQRRSGASTLCTCATLLRARKAPLAPLHYFKQTTRKDPSDSLRSGARTRTQRMQPHAPTRQASV